MPSWLMERKLGHVRAVHARAADVLGRIEKRRQQADGIQDLERAGLDRGGARLAVRPNVALDEPRFHTVAGELGGGEEAGRTGADDEDFYIRSHVEPGWCWGFHFGGSLG